MRSRTDLPIVVAQRIARIGPSNAARKPSPNVQLRLLEVARGVARDAISCRASELFAFQPIPSRQAAYGLVDIRAGLFDVLHVEPP